MNREEEIKKEIEELAILLHHKYEIFSQEEKWKSQDLCRDKPFSQLPLANQKVMIRMAEYVSSLIDTALQQEQARILGKLNELISADLDANKIVVIMHDFLYSEIKGDKE